MTCDAADAGKAAALNLTSCCVCVVQAVLGLERYAYQLVMEEVTSLDVLLKMGERVLEDVGVKSHISRTRILAGAK